MALFHSANIDAIKGPPSSTHRHQAWDCGCLFRGIKQGVERLMRADMPFEDDTLHENLVKFMREFQENSPSIKLTAAFREKITQSLQTICWSAKSSWTAPKMVESFVTIGQHVLGAKKKGESTVDYDSIMSRSYCKHLTAEDVQVMSDQLPAAMATFRQEGRLRIVPIYCYFCYCCFLIVILNYQAG